MPSVQIKNVPADTHIVVDASVLAPALADDGRDGRIVRDRLTGERLTAPEVIDLEVVSVLRGLTRAGKLTSARARHAVDALAAMTVVRASHPSAHQAKLGMTTQPHAV